MTNKNVSLEDILSTIQEWELQSSSPYNDGWVVQDYRQKLQLLKEHLETRKEPQVIT